ncbi:sensor histidine kinase [Streptomyces beihaiensis]|uniref:histidine kinase n=1 Tax=Streptomyces beihaiensis TaxID=2984495 RepID=A0ABT3TW85_9ACTN|nr:HAMP domain-containing sensor histidine kinase [Streptomyces beihaiensis]MCX3061296.1 HAMP domain-containing histidine kinase [Streptomyces beihaiensis]
MADGANNHGGDHASDDESNQTNGPENGPMNSHANGYPSDRTDSPRSDPTGGAPTGGAPRSSRRGTPLSRRPKPAVRERHWLRGPQSLRTKLAVAFAVVAAGVTTLVGFLSYNAAAGLVRVDQRAVFTEVVHDLRDQVRQRNLDADDFSAADPDHDGPRDDVTRPTRTDVQVLGPDGRVVDHGEPALPVTGDMRDTARDQEAGRVVTDDDVRIRGDEYRMATVSLGGGRGAVQVAQEFSDTEDLLRRLQDRTLLFAGAVIAGAGLFGWWLARRVTSRLVRLAGTAENVATTGRLDVAVPVEGGDEVGSLGRSFDRMLGRLARSVEDQRRLVQDAGHELRTPLTSLRTNISLLRRIEELPPAAREELVADLAEESRELTDLVNELVELAAGKEDDEPVTEVALAQTARDVAVLVRRRTGRTVTVGATGDTTVAGRAAQLQRALSNLVENAAKFDTDSSHPIEITVDRVAEGVRVAVMDRGPGIDADTAENASRLFDRFYRAPAARSLPGSGLGLSIVREVVAAHGGTPFARPREGGGAVIGFVVRGVDAEG